MLYRFQIGALELHVIEIVQVIHHHNAPSGPKQMFAQMRANESRSTSD
jgi:hypothetical protein